MMMKMKISKILGMNQNRRILSQQWIRRKRNIQNTCIFPPNISLFTEQVHAIWSYKHHGKCFSTSGPYILSKF